jgi:Holliday junction resolvasome RuvABC ATP-dependent DNA helicase subunit
MATMEELAKSYARELKSARDTKRAADRIFARIEELTYVRTGKPISEADKRQLLDLIQTNIQVDVAFKEADNTSYLALLAYINQKLEAE